MRIKILLALVLATLSPSVFKLLSNKLGYVEPEWLIFQVIYILGLISVGILLFVWVCNLLAEWAYRLNFSKFVSDVRKAQGICIDIRNGQLTIDEAQRRDRIPAYIIQAAMNFQFKEEVINQQEK